MPTATPFKALGKGNGFTNCVSQDITGFDSWTTLSGWSKNNQPSSQSAKLASIEESRRLAMMLFWNLSEVTGTVNTTSYQHGSSSLSSSGNITVQPKNRVCLSNITGYAEDGDGYPAYNKYSILGASNVGFYITAMYNNTQLVGYGVEYGFQSVAFSGSNALRVNARLILRSFEGYTVNQYENRDYVTLNINNDSFSFVCTAHVSTGGGHITASYTINRNALNLLAQGTASRSLAKDNDGNWLPPVQVASSTAQINSFDFYTY
jgi:hypothetical protein